MRTPQNDPLSGDIVDRQAELSVDELSRLCAVDRIDILELVHEGVLTVITVDVPEWRFSGAALRRARLALRLQRDLEINLPGVALALELMEELQTLRREIQAERR